MLKLSPFGKWLGVTIHAWKQWMILGIFVFFNVIKMCGGLQLVHLFLFIGDMSEGASIIYLLGDFEQVT